MTINGIEYVTKEEATKRCKEYAANHPGSSFHNYAHTKAVRIPNDNFDGNDDCHLTKTVYGFEKVFVSDPALSQYPEIKGKWVNLHVNSAKERHETR